MEVKNYWLPGQLKNSQLIDQTFERAQLILQHASDSLCELINEELEVIMAFGDEDLIFWRRTVQSEYEGQICNSFLFNLHRVCKNCGLSICLSCYLENKWPDCTKSCEKENETSLNHKKSDLMLCKIMPDDVLNLMETELHEVRANLGIPCKSICHLTGHEKPAQSSLFDSKLLIEKNPMLTEDNLALFKGQWKFGRLMQEERVENKVCLAAEVPNPGTVQVHFF